MNKKDFHFLEFVYLDLIMGFSEKNKDILIKKRLHDFGMFLEKTRIEIANKKLKVTK